MTMRPAHAYHPISRKGERSSRLQLIENTAFLLEGEVYIRLIGYALDQRLSNKILRILFDLILYRPGINCQSDGVLVQTKCSS